ncbi:DUF397 domain-containing protein [Streptomyces sp. NPDC059255]|uniref:DUF397 domain-containing protein n=1 Tax=Streptomyces sp. NPDC059255 TaxID=3346793 RepID=UPI003687A304
MSAGSKLVTAHWVKSSYSDANGGQCVEVAHGMTGIIPVRDSKAPEGISLVFPVGVFAAFVAHVQAGGFGGG